MPWHVIHRKNTTKQFFNYIFLIKKNNFVIEEKWRRDFSLGSLHLLSSTSSSFPAGGCVSPAVARLRRHRRNSLSFLIFYVFRRLCSLFGLFLSGNGGNRVHRVAGLWLWRHHFLLWWGGQLCFRLWSLMVKSALSYKILPICGKSMFGVWLVSRWGGWDLE